MQSLMTERCDVMVSAHTLYSGSILDPGTVTLTEGF
jgi:hypothetical protein